MANPSLSPSQVSLVYDNARILAQIPESSCDACAQYRYPLPVCGSRDGCFADGEADKSSAGSASESVDAMLE